jgi:hypothetical protein
MTRNDFDVHSTLLSQSALTKQFGVGKHGIGKARSCIIDIPMRNYVFSYFFYLLRGIVITSLDTTSSHYE